MTTTYRKAWADIDLGRVWRNASLLARLVAPASLCTVVKADGYGHGAVEVGRAALDGGAKVLGVAQVEEALVLREAGIDAPVLLFTEAPEDAVEPLIEAGITLTLYRPVAVAATARAADHMGKAVPVHVKVDTGMHRVGADVGDALALCQSVVDAPRLRLDGLWTHFAVADEPDDEFTKEQLARFDAVRRELGEAGIVPRVLHAANSAGAIAHPASRLDLVRCGIASYGYAPTGAVAVALRHQLERIGEPRTLAPVLSLKARVHLVRDLEAGERVSYGRTMPLPRRGRVAVVPFGYADGVSRRLGSLGGEVLIGGKRRPICGTVTMDQLMVDCGDDHVRPGDEVVLIGRQGGEEISADDWARRLGTIAYEVLCGIGARVPRVAGRWIAAGGEEQEASVAARR